MCNNSMALKILLLTIGLLFSASGNAQEQAANTNTKDTSGKFHLIYLVSTDKLEPGAKAFVEPLFFTDGKRLVFAFNYCRHYYLKNHKAGERLKRLYHVSKEQQLNPNQIADDLTPIHQYCENKSSTIQLRDYVVRDTTGITLRLDAARYIVEERSSGPPGLPDKGSAKILAVEGAPLISPETTVKGGQQYFFLMTSNRALLDQIAPINKVSRKEAENLRARVSRYTQARTTGVNRPAGIDVCEIKAINPPTPPGRAPFMLPRKGPYQLSRAQILASLFGDLDGDGLTDLVVSIFEEYPRDRKKFAFDAMTTEIRFFYGDGKEQCLVWDYGVAYKLNPTSLPLGMIELGSCRYLVSSFDASSKSLDLISLSAKDPNCKNDIAYKYLEDV